ncbi:MAG TPA: response regulator [Thermoanaerobaculaceae bacterium]|nr:response regulator [Thermoanaerobaculaceae bacterium]
MNRPVAPVLLVEDDPNDVILIRRAFRDAKVANPLEVAGDGEEAVAYLAGAGTYADRERHPLPSVVLLDLKLPRKSGHEVLAWIRAHQELRRLPVVVLTSSTERADVNRSYELGANSYLTKPVSPANLIEMVRTLQVYWLILNEPPDIAAGGANGPAPERPPGR